MFKIKRIPNNNPAEIHALETVIDLLGIPKKELIKAANIPPELLGELTTERNETNMEIKKPVDCSTYVKEAEIHTQLKDDATLIVRDTLKAELDKVISDINFYKNKNNTKDIKFYKQAIKNIDTILSKYSTQLEQSQSKELLLGFQKLFSKGLEIEIAKESGKDLFDNFHIQLESLSTTYKGNIL